MGVTPSSILGLTAGSYEAYCFDQVIWYFGSTVSGELEQAGRKKQKGETKIVAARKKVLSKFLDEPGANDKPGKFADPALLFAGMMDTD